jgi:predicted nucleic acid-binding protein
VIVLDASAALELLLRTRAGETIEQRVFRPAESLHAPHLLDVEVAQVVRRFARAGDLDDERGRAILQDLADLRIERYPHDILLPRIWELRDTVTAYDAAYLALAELLEAPLLTRDARLAKAAGHRAVVEVI